MRKSLVIMLEPCTKRRHTQFRRRSFLPPRNSATWKNGKKGLRAFWDDIRLSSFLIPWVLFNSPKCWRTVCAICQWLCHESVLGRHSLPWRFLFACLAVIGYHLAQVSVDIGGWWCPSSLDHLPRADITDKQVPFLFFLRLNRKTFKRL